MTTDLERLGQAVRALRESAGMTLDLLSMHLRQNGLERGCSLTHLSEVERGKVWPSDDLIRAIETVLHAPDRLIPLLREAKVPTIRATQGLKIDMHTFFVGHLDQECRLEWSPERHRVRRRDLYVFPFGIAILHFIEHLDVSCLTEAAETRRQCLHEASRRLETHLSPLGLSMLSVEDTPYGLSCFVVRESPWSNVRDLTRAIQILAVPSMLRPVHAPPQRSSSDFNTQKEGLLMASDDALPDLVPFSVPGSHIGAATWSAVAICPEDSESPIVQALIDFEIQLQALWCYSSYWCDTNNRPSVETREFLSASLTELASPNPREHIYTRLLKDALIRSSRLEDNVKRVTAKSGGSWQ